MLATNLTQSTVALVLLVSTDTTTTVPLLLVCYAPAVASTASNRPPNAPLVPAVRSSSTTHVPAPVPMGTTHRLPLAVAPSVMSPNAGCALQLRIVRNVTVGSTSSLPPQRA